MCVHVCKCMYACMYVCTCMCMCVCVSVCVCTLESLTSTALSVLPASGNVYMTLLHGASKGSCATSESFWDLCHSGTPECIFQQKFCHGWELRFASVELGIRLPNIVLAVLPMCVGGTKVFFTKPFL